MTKSRRTRTNKSLIKSLTKTTSIALPIVDQGLTNVGNTAKNVAQTSIPVIEKGVSVVYGTMATGFNLGAKAVGKGISKKRRTKRYRKKSHKTKRNRRY